MFDYLAVIAIKSGNVTDKKTTVLKFPQLKMYEDLNFVNIGGYEKKTPIMIKNLHLLDD